MKSNGLPSLKRIDLDSSVLAHRVHGLRKSDGCSTLFLMTYFKNPLLLLWQAQNCQPWNQKLQNFSYKKQDKKRESTAGIGGLGTEPWPKQFSSQWPVYPIIYQDESGLCVERDKYFFFFFSFCKLTHFDQHCQLISQWTVHLSRSQAVLNQAFSPHAVRLVSSALCSPTALWNMAWQELQRF